MGVVLQLKCIIMNLKSLKKINTLRKDLLIKDMTQFLKNKRMYIDFEIYKEDMLNKRIELAEQQKSRNKSKVSKPIIDKGLEL